MVEKYLGADVADDIFRSAFIVGTMTEKQACDAIESMEKGAQILDSIKAVTGGIKNLVSAGKGTLDLGKDIAKTVAAVGLLGVGTGVLGSTAWDAVKERLSQDDPEAKFNTDVEALYHNRKRELEDQKWMNRVRAMRDDLRRNYKKMSTEEYAEKYRKLQDALDERKS